MATHQGARFLQAQLDSLAAQTLTPFELVVGDDVSTDGTVEMLARFAETAAFPVLVTRNAERLGYGENFLRTAARATGDLIAFCDQDDVWEPSKLARAAAAIGRSGANLHVHAAAVVDDSGLPAGSFTQGIRRRQVVGPLSSDPWGVYYGFSMTFRRELLAALPLELRGRHISQREALLSHDMWIYFLATSLGRTALDPQPLVRYRRHDANETFHVVRPLTMLELTSRLGLAFDKEVGRDRIAADRAALLRRVRPDSPYAAAAGPAAAHWRRVAAVEGRRAAAYSGGDARTRAVAWAGALRGGAYRTRRRGGLGRPLVLKDALAGVLRLRRRANRSDASAVSAPGT